jgi:hypothetical protein
MCFMHEAIKVRNHFMYSTSIGSPFALETLILRKISVLKKSDEYSV